MLEKPCLLSARTPGAKREIYVATITQRANEDEIDANARLIGAAPLLLAACKMVMTRFPDRSYASPGNAYREVMLAVEAAIAAAEGGTA